MRRRAPDRGFTLIELLFAVTLFMILVALAIPMYIDFLANSQVRNAAEAMLNGVTQAQSAAVKANTRAQLVVDPASGWTIQFVTPDGAPVVPAPFLLVDGAPHATIVTTPADATEITFDAFGRIIPNVDADTGVPDGIPTIACIKVSNSGFANPRPMNVVISSNTHGIGTKLCDPAVATTEPQGCPAAACA